MLTWKEIKAFVENGHPGFKIRDPDRLSYLIVHMDEIAFGVVGQDGFAAAQHLVRNKLEQLQTQAEANLPAVELQSTPRPTLRTP
jgi:hypothetical protein